MFTQVRTILCPKVAFGCDLNNGFWEPSPKNEATSWDALGAAIRENTGDWCTWIALHVSVMVTVTVTVVCSYAVFRAKPTVDVF